MGAIRQKRLAWPLRHCSGEQDPSAEREERQNQHHDGVTHDFAYVNSGHSQQRHSEERLSHVGPLVAVGNTHDNG